MPHAVVNTDSIEARNGVFRPMRQALGVSAFGINHLELAPDVEGPEHDHSGDGQEEVYVIVRGGGTIRVDGQEESIRQGDFVFLSPDAKRQMVAGPDGLAWVGVGSQPGGYKPRE
jgi:quercetin dioxygenase-like cupin family protein